MALNRRRFLQSSTAIGLGYMFTAPAFSFARVQGSNERLKVAGIGVGGKGSSDIDQAGMLGKDNQPLMEVIGLCDADKDYLGLKMKKWPKAKGVTDFRRLFDDAELMKAVDAFTISTPDHTHALPAAMAIRQKKHVYVQKPLTQTVFESDLLRKLAKENGVCTQMGNQGTAENGLRRAVELIQGGALGDVKEVHVWTNRPVWDQAPKVMKRYEDTAVPEYLDWEAYNGPNEFRPYAHGPNKGKKRGCYHDFNWRGWWAFGTGAIGDMACHTANMAFMALKLGYPTHIMAEATDVNPETCPSSAHVTLKFPARGPLPGVTLHWYEGMKDKKKLSPPQEWVDKALAIDPDMKRNKKLVDSGSIIIGSKGYLYSPNDYGAQVFFGPSEEFKGMNTTTPEKLAINNKGDQGQKNEWVEAIKAGKPALALSNFDYASYLTGAFLLGNVAIRTGKPLTFDAATLTSPDNADAAKYIKKEYRKGWDMLEKA
ncbi:MAG: Gfo/Idh/MocA family protein [Fimbriiglobus sp.]